MEFSYEYIDSGAILFLPFSSPGDIFIYREAILLSKSTHLFYAKFIPSPEYK